MAAHPALLMPLSPRRRPASHPPWGGPGGGGGACGHGDCGGRRCGGGRGGGGSAESRLPGVAERTNSEAAASLVCRCAGRSFHNAESSATTGPRRALQSSDAKASPGEARASNRPAYDAGWLRLMAANCIRPSRPSLPTPHGRPPAQLPGSRRRRGGDRGPCLPRRSWRLTTRSPPTRLGRCRRLLHVAGPAAADRNEALLAAAEAAASAPDAPNWGAGRGAGSWRRWPARRAQVPAPAADAKAASGAGAVAAGGLAAVSDPGRQDLLRGRTRRRRRGGVPRRRRRRAGLPTTRGPLPGLGH